MRRTLLLVILASMAIAPSARANSDDQFACSALLSTVSVSTAVEPWSPVCTAPLHAGSHELDMTWLPGTTGYVRLTVTTGDHQAFLAICGFIAGTLSQCQITTDGATQVTWGSPALPLAPGWIASYSLVNDGQASFEVAPNNLVCSVAPCLNLAVGRIAINGD